MYFCILCTIFILHAAKNCDLSVVVTHHVSGVSLQERAPPCVDDFLYICDDAYKRSQLITMEISILQALNFDINIPVPYRFLRRYAKVRDNTYISWAHIPSVKRQVELLWSHMTHTRIYIVFVWVCVCQSQRDRPCREAFIGCPHPPTLFLCVCVRLLVDVRSIPIFNSWINWASVKAPWFNNVFICFYLLAEWLVLLIALFTK